MIVMALRDRLLATGSKSRRKEFLGRLDGLVSTLTSTLLPCTYLRYTSDLMSMICDDHDIMISTYHERELNHRVHIQRDRQASDSDLDGFCLS